MSCLPTHNCQVQGKIKLIKSRNISISVVNTLYRNANLVCKTSERLKLKKLSLKKENEKKKYTEEYCPYIKKY